MLEGEKELHVSKPPDKTAKSNTVSNYKEKEAYLDEEVSCIAIYCLVSLTKYFLCDRQ